MQIKTKLTDKLIITRHLKKKKKTLNSKNTNTNFKKYSESSHFTLLFGRGRQRKRQRIILNFNACAKLVFCSFWLTRRRCDGLRKAVFHGTSCNVDFCCAKNQTPCNMLPKTIFLATFDSATRCESWFELKKLATVFHSSRNIVAQKSTLQVAPCSTAFRPWTYNRAIGLVAQKKKRSKTK